MGAKLCSISECNSIDDCKANNFQSKGDNRWIKRAASGIWKYIYMRERNSAGEHKSDIQGTPDKLDEQDNSTVVSLATQDEDAGNRLKARTSALGRRI